MKKQLTITVGIPTCYGGASLVDTARSILNSRGVKITQFIIVADRNPISKKIRQTLEEMGIKVIENSVVGSQRKKLKQMIAMATGDIYIATQDDIFFAPETLAALVNDFEQDPTVTMLGSRVLPLTPQTAFEGAMGVGVRIVDRTACSWKNGVNHLAVSGRCLAFRTNKLKEFRIPEEVINGDMYLYLENRRLGGVFRLVRAAKVYLRCPVRLKDQIGPTSRYQYSKTEMQTYFDFDVTNEYRLPKYILVRSLVTEFLLHPRQAIHYIGIFLYTRLKKQSIKKTTNALWQIDLSTKHISRLS